MVCELTTIKCIIGSFTIYFSNSTIAVDVATGTTNRKIYKSFSGIAHFDLLTGIFSK
jgi:hypothetical protein